MLINKALKSIASSGSKLLDPNLAHIVPSKSEIREDKLRQEIIDKCSVNILHVTLSYRGSHKDVMLYRGRNFSPTIQTFRITLEYKFLLIVFFEQTKDLKNRSFDLPPNGIITLKIKPEIQISNTIDDLKNGNDEKKKRAIFELRQSLNETEFAIGFVKAGGIQIICDLILASSGNMLAYSLGALDASFILGVETLSQQVLDKIISLIENSNLNVASGSLKIVTFLLKTPHNYDTIDGTMQRLAKENKYVPYTPLFRNLFSNEIDIQTHTLGFFNSLVENCPTEKKTEFLELLRKDLNITKGLKFLGHSPNPIIQRQLYIYQVNCINQMYEGRNEQYDEANQEHFNMLTQLWELTFPDTPLELQGRVSQQWKLLGVLIFFFTGFQGTDPVTDFRGMGLICLRHLVYFASHYTLKWRQIVQHQLEIGESNLGSDYPVATCGVNVSSMLFTVLNGGKPVQHEGSEIYYPVLWDSAFALEELYCIALLIVDKLWEEMEATYMQFQSVINAAKELFQHSIENSSTLQHLVDHTKIEHKVTGVIEDLTAPQELKIETAQQKQDADRAKKNLSIKNKLVLVDQKLENMEKNNSIVLSDQWLELRETVRKTLNRINIELKANPPPLIRPTKNLPVPPGGGDRQSLLINKNPVLSTRNSLAFSAMPSPATQNKGSTNNDTNSSNNSTYQPPPRANRQSFVVTPAMLAEIPLKDTNHQPKNSQTSGVQPVPNNPTSKYHLPVHKVHSMPNLSNNVTTNFQPTSTTEDQKIVPQTFQNKRAPVPTPQIQKKSLPDPKRASSEQSLNAPRGLPTRPDSQRGLPVPPPKRLSVPDQ